MKKVILLAVAVATLMAGCVQEPTTPKKGELCVYIMKDFGCGAINVEVDGAGVGALTSYFNGNKQPTCGVPGTITVSLEPGVYDVFGHNSCGVYWQQTVTIKSGVCRELEFS